MKITNVHGREILDSRGNPTVEVDVTLEGGAFGPRGGAVGRVDRRARGARAARRRQGAVPRQGRAQGGRATSTARSRRRSSAASFDQRALDEAMIALDGTPTKSRLGANALLGVSMARRAGAAAAAGMPLYAHIASLDARWTATGPYTLPVPMMNILNGGAHADSSVDFQEFMVMPVGAPSFARGAARGRRDLPRAARAS